MKRLYPLLLILFLFSGCSTYYNHIIEADYSYQGQFNRYKTYDFVARNDFQGTKAQKESIENYIKKNLEIWGYKRKVKKPNLIIFYNLYFDDIKLTGYRQPDFENWLKWNFSKRIIAQSEDSIMNFEDYLADFGGGSDYREDSYDQVKYQMREGTLLISLYDRRRNQTIWQGYASGIMGENEFNNDRIIRHIVSRVLDKYRVLAVGAVNL